MNEQVIDKSNCVAIGGTGGSGTRLIAEICKQSGVFIGDNFNNISIM